MASRSYPTFSPVRETAVWVIKLYKTVLYMWIALCCPLLFLGVQVISKEHVINEKIRDKEVRLIGSEGEQLGIVSSQQALDIAADRFIRVMTMPAPMGSRSMQAARERSLKQRRVETVTETR